MSFPSIASWATGRKRLSRRDFYPELDRNIIVISSILIAFDKSAEGMRNRKEIYNTAIRLLETSRGISPEQKQYFRMVLKKSL